MLQVPLIKQCKFKVLFKTPILKMLLLKFCYTLLFMKDRPLSEKCPYLELFWSVFSRIRTEYGPEQLRIRTLFT